jgi:hypothetical protein
VAHAAPGSKKRAARPTGAPSAISPDPAHPDVR